MAIFVARRTCDDNGGWGVFGPDGEPHPEAASFLLALYRSDRAPQTRRSYAHGLADFLSWLAAGGIALDEVSRTVVGEYIDAFRHGPKHGATRVAPETAGTVNSVTRKRYPTARRQPGTVNHRLSLLAGFFAHLIGRDTEREDGP